MTLLKTQGGYVPTTINTLVNYFCIPLTRIAVQVLYAAIQNDLIPHNYHYFIYCLQPSLRIFKFGYLASNIVITSRPLSRALILCITPFPSQSLMTYGHPINILESSVGIMKNTMNGYIYELLISTLAYRRVRNNTQTHQHASLG